MAKKRASVGHLSNLEFFGWLKRLETGHYKDLLSCHSTDYALPASWYNAKSVPLNLIQDSRAED